MTISSLPTSLPRKRIPIDFDLFSESGNQYKIKCVIGEGATSIVFKAVCNLQKRNYLIECAVKIFFPLQYIVNSKTGYERIRKRFEEEWKRSKHLDHPNIMKILDGGIVRSKNNEILNNSPFYAMPIVEGKTLDEFIQKDQLKIEHKMSIALQLADAVQYLHHNKILHRDIKPQNIFISSDYKLTLGDFGVMEWGEFAKDYSGGVQTYPSEILTTWDYLPPEVEIGNKYSLASESWSFGKVFLEIINWEKYFRVEILLKKYAVHTFYFQKEIGQLVSDLLRSEPKNRISIKKSFEHIKKFFENLEDQISTIPNLNGRDRKNIIFARKKIKEYRDPIDSGFSHKRALSQLSKKLYFLKDFEYTLDKCSQCGSKFNLHLCNTTLGPIDEDYYIYHYSFCICLGKPGKPCGIITMLLNMVDT